MKTVLDAAIAYVASTARWSNDANRLRGTLWYGIMCRSFQLLEQMLRLSLVEVSAFATKEVRAASISRAGGKDLRSMTFGQCLGVLEEIAPFLPSLFLKFHPLLLIPADLFPENDRIAWNRVVSLRNRLAHDGPGFFDSVDWRAGRMWRQYTIEKPLHYQANEVSALGRQLCRSAYIVTCIGIQKTNPSTAIAKFDAAEGAALTLKEIGQLSEAAINEFHSPASPEK